MSGLRRRHTGAHVPLDVLDDYNRIVDDNSDCQHQPKQREVVEGNAEGVKNPECSDQRDRNRYYRNDCSSPVLQKQEHDPQDEEDSNKNRNYDFMDGFGDKDRWVVDDLVVNARGKLFREFFH